MAKLLIPDHFLSFPLIRPNPHPDPLPEEEGVSGRDARLSACAGNDGACAEATRWSCGDPFGLVRPRLLLTVRLEMRPPWPRLALRSLVRAGPASPRCGLGWPRHEWPGVAKFLVRLHSVAFRLIPIVCAGQGGRGCEVAAFAVTTKPLTLARTLTLALSQRARGLTTHAINVRAGAATAQWAVVVVLGQGRSRNAGGRGVLFHASSLCHGRGHA